MSTEKLVVDLKPQESRSIVRLASLLSLEEKTTERFLKRASSGYARLFGVRPYDIVYDPMRGSIIRARSSIGYVDVGPFLLRLNPFVKGLDIGKCVGLAQKCGFGFLSRFRNEIVRRKLSDAESYSAIDFFAQSLMAAVSTVIINGLDRKLEEKLVNATKIGGTIKIQESVERAKIKVKPLISEVMASHNTPPNRYILTALLKCKEQCKSTSVIRWATSLIDYFKGVIPYGGLDEVEIVPKSYFSVPRADYEQALLLSKIVLEGSSWKRGQKASFLPMFTIDLDALFERYVSYMLKQLLSTKKFAVEIQPEYKHPTKPHVFWKSFIPDIVIRLLKSASHQVVLDVKNKYTIATTKGAGYVGNKDIFQISYYCHALKSPVGFLVFPGGKNDATKYPLRSSESKNMYEAKRRKALEQIIKNNRIVLFVKSSATEVQLFKWMIDLSGTLRNSAASVASLAQFVADLIEGKDGFA